MMKPYNTERDGKKEELDAVKYVIECEVYD